MATLNADEKVQVSKLMQRKIAQLETEGNSLADDDLQRELSKELVDVVSKLRSISSIENHRDKPQRKKKGTRRRSFDPDKVKSYSNLKIIPLARPDDSTHQSTKKSGVDGLKKQKKRRSFDADKPANKSELGISESTPQLISINDQSKLEAAEKLWNDDLADDWHIEQSDHWDSVQHQPRCYVCRMTFRTDELLNRHMWSALHKTNANLKAIAIEKQQFEEAQNLKQQNHSTELLYSGEKSFWKTKRSVAIDLVLHIAAHVIEVIGIDVETYREYNRLYFSRDKMSPLISHQSEASTVIAEHVSSQNHSQHNSPVRPTYAGASVGPQEATWQGGQSSPAVAPIDDHHKQQQQQQHDALDAEEETERRSLARHILQRLVMNLEDPTAEEAIYLLGYESLLMDHTTEKQANPQVDISAYPKWLVEPVPLSEHAAIKERDEDAEAVAAAALAEKEARAAAALRATGDHPVVTELGSKIDDLVAHLAENCRNYRSTEEVSIINCNTPSSST